MNQSPTRMLDEPIPIQEWINDHALSQDDALYAKKSGVAQAMFIRDNIELLFNPTDIDRLPLIRPDVVSWHTSKSVKLGVYHVKAEALGVEVWMRGNFYNWIVSVYSQRPIQDTFFRLFDHAATIDPVFAEGFDEQWIFGSYEQNNCEFTIQLPRLEDAVWAFLYLLVERARTPGVTLNISEEGARSFLSDSPGWGAMGLQEITEGIEQGLGIVSNEKMEPGVQSCPCGCGRNELIPPKFKRDDVVVCEGRLAVVMFGGSYHIPTDSYPEGYWQYALSEDGTQVRALPNNPYKEDEIEAVPPA